MKQLYAPHPGHDDEPSEEAWEYATEDEPIDLRDHQREQTSD
jgi:hypothetical protein